MNDVLWNVLINAEALASLLPGDQARLARPIKAGLVVFCSSLPVETQKAILSEQATLPATTSLAVRLGLLARRCPVLHKLGQLLARDQRLAEELRRELRPLETLPPSTRQTDVHAVLTQELGSLAERGIELLGPPIAEASVAVVIPFRELSRNETRAGVFKVLKPGIESRLECELEILGRVGAHLDNRCDDLRIPPLDYRETFEQVRDKLRWETRLDQEQRHLLDAAAFYRFDHSVQIPELFEHCTARVTAMERIFGQQVTEQHFEDEREKRQLIGNLTHAVLARPFFSRSSRGMFHGDPHAGNLLYTVDGRLALLDWSLVGYLGESERIAMGQMILSAVSLDASQLIAVLTGLDVQQRVDATDVGDVVRRWLSRIVRGQLPGLNWLVGLLDDAAQSTRLRMSTDMMMFRKSLHTLEGVVRDLGAAESDIENTLLAEFCCHFAQEWPARWFCWPTSRQFATRLSNLDLATTVFRWPLTALRLCQASNLYSCGHSDLSMRADSSTSRRPPSGPTTPSSIRALYPPPATARSVGK